MTDKPKVYSLRLTPEQKTLIDRVLQWHKGMTMLVEAGAIKEMPDIFDQTPTIPTIHTEPRKPLGPGDPGWNCDPGFGVSVTNFLGGFKGKPCDNDDYYEFDGTIPEGIINEVLAGNNAEETARIVAQTQAAMKKQYATGVILERERYIESLRRVRDAYAIGC